MEKFVIFYVDCLAIGGIAQCDNNLTCLLTLPEQKDACSMFTLPE